MSEKCDAQRQVRISDNSYRQLAYIKRKSPANPSISFLVNMAVELSIKELIDRMLTSQNQTK